jgi:hypothetical protein
MSTTAALFYIFLSHLPTLLNSGRTPHTFTLFILIFYCLQLSLCDTLYCNTGILEAVNENTAPGFHSQTHMGEKKKEMFGQKKKGRT